MKYILLLIPLLFSGCAKKQAEQAGSVIEAPQVIDAEFIASVTAIELSGDKKSRKALKEVSDALDVFCGQQEINSLALVGLFKSKLGKLRDRRRIAILLLLLDRAGAEINPSDYVQWGGLACKLRQGIKFGLDFGAPE